MNETEGVIDLCGGLLKLNSMTKYPSISTFHEMGDRGRFKEQVFIDLKMPPGPLIVTEKIDGVNGRIILLEDGWIIGSREELLAARGDLITNPALGIVAALRDRAEEVWSAWMVQPRERIVVIYPEVHGGKTTSTSRNYSPTNDDVRVRVFDVATISVPLAMELAKDDRDRIAAWREHDSSRFHKQDVGVICGLDFDWPRTLPLVPAIGTTNDIPVTWPGTLEWMRQQVAATAPCALAAMDPAKVEGLVVRTQDRGWIRKLRFEDYERTLGLRRGGHG